MRAGLEQLRFQPVEEPVSEVLSMAVNARRGAPVVRNSAGAGFSVTPPNKNPCLLYTSDAADE